MADSTVALPGMADDLEAAPLVEVTALPPATGTASGKRHADDNPPGQPGRSSSSRAARLCQLLQ